MPVITGATDSTAPGGPTLVTAVTPMPNAAFRMRGGMPAVCGTPLSSRA